MKLSVVMPVFAEEETVDMLVARMTELLAEKLLEIIIVISPCSPEPTRQRCLKLSEQFTTVTVLTQKEFPGVGCAYREGFSEARGTHVLMLDSDGEMDVETVPLLLEKMEKTGAKIVLGSRWARGGGAVGYDPLKYILNRGFQCIFRVLFRTAVHDLTFGYKLMDAEIVRSIKWTAHFQDIGAETTMKPIRAGFVIDEVPTVWKRRGTGASTNSFWKNFSYVSYAISVLRARRDELLKNP
jgi:dolichol-phosphate mannosyltransferase